MVAWAVPEDIDDHHHGGVKLTIHNERHLAYAPGSHFDSHKLSASPIEDGYHAPIHHERYVGMLDHIQSVSLNEDSRHEIFMSPATGRIVVDITDPGDLLGKTDGEPHVVVNGTMSQMNLDKEGVGSQISVKTPLDETSPATRATNGATHTSELFGVMPSEPGRTLSVAIMNGDQLIQTLSVTTDERRHQAIRSGELLEFDYVIGSAEFNLTVGSWTERIVIDEKGGL
jgi:hypothetical protein